MTGIRLSKSDYSLVRKGLPQRQIFSRETQLDPPSLLYRLMKHPKESSQSSTCDIWRILSSETAIRGLTKIWWCYWIGSEQLAWRLMKANVSSLFSMTECTRQQRPFRGLGWLNLATFHFWEPWCIYKVFCELYIRKGKRLRE